MKLIFKAGDIVDETTDGLVCSGNVQLNMSGGVNGELLLRGGQDMQRQLHEFLRRQNRNFVEPGFVMEIGPTPTQFKCIVYTVAVDGFYGSSVDLVQTSLTNALALIESKGCRTVAVPALATGYGPLSLSDFALALRRCLNDREWRFDEVLVVLRNDSDRDEVSSAYQQP